MREEKIRFSIIWKIIMSLLPILFGMPTLAMVLCSYNIVMSFLFMGPLTMVVASLSGVGLSMFFCSSFGEGALLSGLFLGLEAVLCAIACIYTVVQKKGFYPGVFSSSLMFLLVSFTELMKQSQTAGMSAAEYLTSVPIELSRMQLASFSESGVNIPAETIEKLLSQLRELTVMIVPSVLVISSLAVGYAIMWLVVSNLRRIPGGMKHSFSEIRLPKITALIIVLAFILFVMNPKGSLSYVFLNVLIILLALYVFSGISILDFYMRRFIKNTFLRIIIHVFLIVSTAVFMGVSPYLNLFVVYVLLALIDSFVKLRRPLKREKGGEEDVKEAGED